MLAKQWKSKIRKACSDAGTYRKYFDAPIAALADILEQRDHVMEEYVASGSVPVVTHTNKAGASNVSKNPLLMLWDELNKTALAYWRDLGLTPKGLKAIDEQAMKPQKVSGLVEVFASLED